MSRKTRSVRVIAIPAVLIAVLASGCGGTAPATSRQAAPAAPSAVQPDTQSRPAEDRPATQQVRATPPPTAAAVPAPVEPTPSELPPGDPGLDAPSVPDPGTAAPDPHAGHGAGETGDHDAPRRGVPLGSLLDTATVAAVLGGRWQSASARPVDCTPTAGRVADRSLVHRSGATRLLETVATYRNLPAADRAVAATGRALQDCGWTVLRDPRLGSASVALEHEGRSETAVVTAADGVTVAVVGTSVLAADQAGWTGVLDLAMGNACAAAAEGCH